MRVASPFNDYAKDSLHLYRVLDPEMWVRLYGRVKGANFGAIYGKTKAMGLSGLTLPRGTHLGILHQVSAGYAAPRLRKNYIAKFKTSIQFWHKTGGGLEERVIQELIEKAIISGETACRITRL